MASQLRSLKIPGALAEIADIRAKALGYASWAAYVKALVVFDGACLSQHTVTVPWSKEPLPVQDRIHEKVLERVKAGRGLTAARLKKMKWEEL